jgi:polysaccharide biosynthesis protein PslH
MDSPSTTANSANGFARSSVRSSTRRRLVFLSQCLPFPPHSGVTNRTYNILRQLQSEFDVTLLAFSRRNHQANKPARESARVVLTGELSDVREPATIASEASNFGAVLCHFKSLVTNRPYTYFDYGSPLFGRQLRDEMKKRRPDLVHMDSLDLHRWLDDIPRGCPVVCAHHNIESELLRLRAARIKPKALSLYMDLQADRIERLEKRLCPGFALNAMVSDLDGERLRQLAPGSRTLTVANGVDIEFFEPPRTDTAVPGRVAFLGPTYMFPNRDGIQFFLAQAWPQVRRSVPEATLHLIGKGSDLDRDRFEAHPGVVCRGYVTDIRPHMMEASCAIVPLRVGGGTRLKILDAWAMGRAIVSTTIGAEGLSIRDGENILIRDHPEEFAQAVVRVLRDRDLRLALERNARTTAVEVYAWDRIGTVMRSGYHALLPVER